MVTPIGTRAWEATAAALMRQAWGGRKPLTDAVEVTVLAMFERPQRLLKRGMADERIPHTVRVDCDNLLKCGMDALVLAEVLRDDCIVYRAEVFKFFAARNEAPSVVVEVRGCE